MPSLPQRLTRFAALVASLALALPARAAEPGDGDLSAQAQKALTDALDDYDNKKFAEAEEGFKRFAFFAPKWRPLHFNLGVVAEAQGKLGTAIREYEAFKPVATPDEALVTDQRIFELGERRSRIARQYKQQIAVGATTVTLGVLGVGAGAALIALGLKAKGDAEDKQSQIDSIMGGSDTTLLEQQRDDLKKQSGRFLAGAYVGLIAGLLFLAYGVIPLSKAIKAKRQLDGIALGPTRLQWAGGAGVRLRF